MKSLSPHSTGELWPSPPGSSIRQFSSPGFQLAGIVVVSVSPVPFGPRNRVHSWAAAIETITAGRAANQNERSAVIGIGRTSIRRETNVGQTFLSAIGRDLTSNLMLADRNGRRNEVAGRAVWRYGVAVAARFGGRL